MEHEIDRLESSSIQFILTQFNTTKDQPLHITKKVPVSRMHVKRHIGRPTITRRIGVQTGVGNVGNTWEKLDAKTKMTWYEKNDSI